MNLHFSFRYIISIFCVFFIAIHCTEHSIESDFESNLTIDTLTINNLNISNYSVAPNLATNERLYIGEKNGIHIPFSFIKIGSSNYWSYYNDSTINLDSVQFKLYFEDSSKSSDLGPLELYFSPDSQFNENLSTYLDYEGFSVSGWHPLGNPMVLDKTDSSDLYTHSELVWRIDSLMSLLSDSGVTRTFALKFADSDSNFMELFSEEASIEEKDPKVVLFYRRTITSATDSIIIDTLSNSIYSSADLSIFDPRNVEDSFNFNKLSNGAGKRAVLMFPFADSSLPKGSVIRSADLIIPIVLENISEDFRIIIDPIENDSMSYFDSSNVFSEDPFTGVGYPYRLSNIPDSSEYVVSIKNILQNIILENEYNYGLKIVSEEKNNPFESILFLSNDSLRSPKIEIIYIYDEE
tara:strand:+ start:425 stop:1648 length:1224 start_codon:yes stop_codon:yes gene_type:complete